MGRQRCKSVGQRNRRKANSWFSTVKIHGARDSVRQEVLREIKDSLANELSHIIIDEYEKFLVSRLVDENYAYLSSRDRDIIKRKVAFALDGRAGRASDLQDGVERKPPEKQSVGAACRVP